MIPARLRAASAQREGEGGETGQGDRPGLGDHAELGNIGGEAIVDVHRPHKRIRRGADGGEGFVRVDDAVAVEIEHVAEIQGGRHCPWM